MAQMADCIREAHIRECGARGFVTKARLASSALVGLFRGSRES
jgi:hypothetical protein